MKWGLIAQGHNLGDSLATALQVSARKEGFDRLDVAVAYATLQGVKALEMALNGFPIESRWVVGLDDGVTQPETLSHLLALPGSILRLASMAPSKRFHPKLYCLWSSRDATKCTTVVGSGNLTLNGLRSNGEAAVHLTSETREEAEQLRNQWTTLWGHGIGATQEAIDTYRSRYDAARKQRRIIVRLGISPPEPSPDAPVESISEFDGNPANANVAWLEAGSPSAGGLDLEFPRVMMPFFALTRSPSKKAFQMCNGDRFKLTFTERTDNQMWRLLFSRDAVIAAIGRQNLKPTRGGNRSDLAIVFEKTDGPLVYIVKMVKIGSSEHNNLMARSRAVNSLQRTRGAGGRNFGFY